MSDKVLDKLVEMSREIGRPENDFVIIGEGNTSAKCDDGTFYVKGSGKCLAQSDKDTFVKVVHQKALDVMDAGELSDSEIKDALFACCADPENTTRPSVETTFHAYLLSLPGVNFVAHTHATACNKILCSEKAEEIYKRRIFPDEIAVCGPEPIYVPYTDPGLTLSRTIRAKVTAYREKHGTNPKLILMQNHGIIAVGASANECVSITAMAVKTARVLFGAYCLGGARYFTEENVNRIYTRPDELYRMKQFAEEK